ncbi:MAG: aminotransferase class I/II-fold pyridoxal phosphate-dependent enzyme [Candidatus Micrarchaeia archaeon]
MISNRTKKIKYAIRDLEVGVKPGTIKINIGDPLAYDLKLPKIMERELIRAVRKGYNYYSDSQGLYDLRKEIGKKENVSPDDVIITSGTSEAINFIFASLLNKGDEVILPTPCYPQYPSMVYLWSGKPVFYHCDSNWVPYPNEIRKKITKKTKAVLLINPNNPTGAVYPKDILEEVCKICEEKDLILISDEIYSDLIFEGKFYSVADLSNSKTIVLNGVSKCYLAPGWRIGWITFHNFKDNNLKESILKLCRLRLCANTPAQFAIANVLKYENHNGKNYLEEVINKLRKRREFMMKKFSEYGINCVRPKGTFYAFPWIENKGWKNDMDFVLKLRDRMKVLVVHGSGFYYKSKDIHFRIVFLPNEKILGEALDRIGKFINKKIQK